MTMVLKNCRISPQYAAKKEILITILRVVNPAHFIIKESPGVDSSPQARGFIEVEASMQKFFSLVDQSLNTQIPSKDSIVVVFHKSKFYRAKVISIFTLTAGYSYKVYLLDYGEEINVPSTCIYEIHQDFLSHPFQAVHFKLLGIEPVSLVMSSIDLTMSYGPVTEWDLSAENFINNLLKEMHSFHVEVKISDQDCLYGKLFMAFGNGSVKCLNDELILKKFARFNENCIQGAAENVIKENAVSKSSSPCKDRSNSPDLSPACIDDFKVSFIRPSDGKVVAESTLKYSSPPRQPDDSESSLKISPMNKSSFLLKQLKLLKLKSPPQSDAVCDSQQALPACDSPSNNSLPSSLNESTECSSKPDVLESSPKQVVSPRQVWLQNLQKMKLNKSLSPILSDSKPNTSAINHEIPETLPSSNCGNIKSSPSHPSNESSTESFHSSSENPRHLAMLQKLQNLKSKKFPKSPNGEISSTPAVTSNSVLENTSIDISNCETTLNVSQSSVSSSEMSLEASRSIAVKDLSSDSLDSPVSRKVSSKKLEAFFLKNKKKLSSSHSLQADICNSASNDISSEILKPDGNAPEKDANPNQTDKSKDESLGNADMPVIILPDPEEGDFVCSSPKQGRKINLSPAGSESTVNSNNQPEFKKQKVSKKGHTMQSLNESSSSDSVIKPDHFHSKILQDMSRLSDSDDIWSKLATKRKNDSFTDKSDLDDSYGDLDVKLDDSTSRQPIEFQVSSLWEKQKVPVLQIGTAIPKPILSIEEAEFSTSLRQVLREIKFRGPSSIQSVVWPSIARRRSLIAIAPPHSGKTISYVLPLVSTFTDSEIPLPKGVGPFAIILCSSWKKAQAVNDYFSLFLGDTKLKIATLCTFEGKAKQKVLTRINGSDVLISNPFTLMHCLKNNLVNFSRCTNLIFDDGTALMTYQKNEIKEILLHFVEAVITKDVRPQIVVCAERWSKHFNIILDNLMSMPLIFFTSFLESAIYAKIQFKCHVCQESEKRNILLNAIKDAAKVVICTTNKEDSTEVHHFLRCEDVRTYLVTEDLEHYIADEVIRDWKSARCKTAAHSLVITDQALTDMNISCADCLVHYDIPHDSRLQFGNRFSCIAENFQEKELSEKCVCHILVTEKDHRYVPHLVKIIESSCGKAPKEIKTLCKTENMDMRPTNPLCRQFKAFGFCRQSNCEDRHTVCSELDKPNVVPCEGDILAVVTHVVDATHFYVRMLKYVNPVTQETVSLTTSYAKVSFSLRNHYCNAAYVIVDEPVVGEVYVLAEEGDLFYRIKVLEKVPPSTLSDKHKWKLLYLDEGWIKCVAKLKIYPLSSELKLPAPLAAEVYVCNIMTPDASLEWNPRTNYLVSGLIKGKEIHGKIVLCLGDTLWLDPVLQRKHLNSIGDYINVLKLDQQLVDFGHAKENKMHIQMLRKACEDKIPMPCIIKPSIKKEIKKTNHISSYAFLECDIDEDVYVSSVISPQQFYVQRAKFVDCLDDLLDKINAEVENKTLKRIFSFYKDMQCIGPFLEDNRYYRAIVTDILEDDHVQLFYPDFGDSGRVSKREIYALTSELTLLPFQGIECSLAGVSAAHGGWSEAASDKLYDLTRDDAGDMKILQLKVYGKTVGYRGGNHYSVELWHENKSLSQQLVDAGFGVPAKIPILPSNDKCDKNKEKQNDEDDSRDESSDELAEKEAVDFVACLLEKMAQDHCSEAPAKVSPTIVEVTSEEEEAVPLIVKRVPHKMLKESKTNDSMKSTENQVNSIKPLITWWNTPEQLSVLINLKNVKLYDLQLKDEGFSFNTIIAGVQYATEERFYEKVQSQSASIYQNCHGINIVAKKQVPHKWPRLVAEKSKFLHIKYDLIHIDDLESEELSGDVNKNYQLSIEPEYVEEEEESTDDEEKHVEPWKKIADPYHSLL